MAHPWILTAEDRLSDRRLALTYLLHSRQHVTVVVDQRRLTPELIHNMGEELALSHPPKRRGWRRDS